MACEDSRNPRNATSHASSTAPVPAALVSAAAEKGTLAVMVLSGSKADATRLKPAPLDVIGKVFYREEAGRRRQMKLANICCRHTPWSRLGSSSGEGVKRTRFPAV